MAEAHDPVMVAEAVDALGCRPGGLWVDATVGAGGHAAALLERTAPDGFLLGIDRDPEILALAAQRLSPHAGRFSLVHGTFGRLEEIVSGVGRGPADGVLIDLGLSSLQLDDPGRGFSFRTDAPLDMRMDRSDGSSALDLVASADEAELARVIFEYGEERQSRRIARAICRERERGGALTTQRLATAVAAAVGGRGPRGGRIHPATRTFQALRIAVNRELEELDAALAALPAVLAPGGRACVIAYHSLEDRAVKRAFRSWSHRGRGEGPAAFELLTKKPRQPAADELQRNPRARSARLRAIARAA
ncbi:MAG TPA: 16S rRNA (cytosine(1402)-N(4))-methyltransferase RsmH [Candidatus Methanoperedens sp.]|nr:16S rRNA (cytosine(1402)-N(4))-methyltransferase RsmH [Candidatus Methanoperedens sp.]